MATFQECFDWWMSFEDPQRKMAIVRDKSAQAISGINSKAFPVDFARIAAIPQADRGPAISTFYSANIWNKWYAQLPAALAMRVSDFQVNAGAKRAVETLQQAVNIVRATAPFIAEDKAWGPLTLAAVNALDPVALQTVFTEGRCAFYRELAAKNPADATYLEQWLARAQA